MKVKITSTHKLRIELETHTEQIALERILIEANEYDSSCGEIKLPLELVGASISSPVYSLEKFYLKTVKQEPK